MRNWKDITITGVNTIDRVVAEFHVWATGKIPYGKFKVKILENKRGGFVGVPNLAVKNETDGTPDYISGLGSSIEEALEDTIKYFFQTLEGRENLSEDDFEWSDPHDF
ncbi:hypothetical protein P4V47_25895 [Brevibacillus laterosporus]|uniref:hypothetical protein n=1 Tax=Brevibacillus laterosporus TaxID=1465 RepID=UPI0018CE89A7|nr:hypothetical protein [Brevibacillus laterosporus]MBG9790326.1 hypothetical protein [Brevibacillus laterosporus]MCG7317503.1 hypothetical protein [Brevibacillus laterosporus]MED1790853.1 hypothetical protein [Brevibacillus laterosporus]